MSALERFYVREHEGYPYRANAPGSGSKPHIEVMVIDRDYCHQVVRSFRVGTNGNDNYSTVLGLERRRKAAAELCAELNAERKAA